MRHPLDDRHVPRRAVIGAAAVVGFAVLAAGAGQVAGLAFSSAPTAAVLESRELRFADRADGAVTVHEGRAGGLVAVVPPGSDGFLRGAMRGLARERLRRDIGAEPPFRLARFADGRLTLDDPMTGHRVDLTSFGPTNARAFARLLGGPAAGTASP